MNKLLLLLCIQLTAFAVFSQSPEKILRKAFKSNPDYSDFYIKSVYVCDEVEDDTYFLTAQIQKKQMVYLMNFKVVHDVKTNNYTAEKLDVSHNEVYKNTNSNFFKLDGNIYRLRVDEGKKGTLIYADKFKLNKFEMAEKPFYQTTEQLAGSKDIHKAAKSFFITTTPYGDKHKAYTISEFTLDFEFTSTSTFTPEKTIDRSYFVLIGNQLVLAYQYTKEDKTVGYGVWANGEKSEFNLAGKGNLVDLTMWEMKGKLNFFFLIKNENTLGSHLIEFDVNNKTIQSLNEESNLYKLDQGSKEIITVETDKDAEGNRYVVCTFAKLDADRAVMSTGDLLVMKLADNSVSWIQFIERSEKLSWATMFPEVHVKGNNLEIIDQELKIYFDEQGNFNPDNGKRKPLASTIDDYTDLKIELDLKTGKVISKKKAE